MVYKRKIFYSKAAKAKALKERRKIFKGVVHIV